MGLLHRRDAKILSIHSFREFMQPPNSDNYYSKLLWTICTWIVSPNYEDITNITANFPLEKASSKYERFDIVMSCSGKLDIVLCMVYYHNITFTAIV
jgi:hypothetical protein